MPVKRDKQAKKLTSVKKKVSATKQAEENRRNNPSPLNGTVLPAGFEAHPERRHNGAWKKEDTLRYKLQQVAKLDQKELYALIDDETAGEYERSVARILLDVAEPQNKLTSEERWRILNGLTNQDSGMPKQQVDQTNYEAPIPLSPRQIITEPKIKPTKPKQKSTRKKTKKK